jgi:hypothetical protein
MSPYKPKDQEREIYYGVDGDFSEIDAYLDRFTNLSPEKILKYMGESRDFFLENMTPEGREFFYETRLEDSLSYNL